VSLPGTVSVVVEESTVAVAVTDRAKDGARVMVTGFVCPLATVPRLQTMLRFVEAQPAVPETKLTLEENVK